jgi:putative flippase GtrA
MCVAPAEPFRARVIREYGRKFARFVLVSLLNVLVGQSLLVLGHSVFGWSFATSNVFAVAVSAGPAYVLTRYWVWEKRSDSHFGREVIPFWALAFLGVVISTLAAAIANRYSNAQIVLNVVSLATFGTIWVFKFFILDRFLFGAYRQSVVSPQAEGASSLP